MANFFEDNEDILFHFQNLDIDETPQAMNSPMQSCDFAEIGYEGGRKETLKEVLKICNQYEEDWDHSISDWIKEELGK